MLAQNRRKNPHTRGALELIFQFNLIHKGERNAYKVQEKGAVTVSIEENKSR